MSYWVVMTVAMMGPASLAGIRHTAQNSLCWRRGRAMMEYATAYLLVWTAFGGIVLGLSLTVGLTPNWRALAVTLAIATLWQLTPSKQRWLRACHRGIPLPPSGWQAERAALRFGLSQGVACLGSCWSLMLLMAAAPIGHLFMTIALSAVVTAERMVERPVRAARRHAVGLGAAALVTAVVAMIA